MKEKLRNDALNIHTENIDIREKKQCQNHEDKAAVSDETTGSSRSSLSWPSSSRLEGGVRKSIIPFSRITFNAACSAACTTSSL